MATDVQQRSSMSPYLEPAKTTNGQSAEFHSFTRLLELLLSVPRADLRKKMDGDESSPDETTEGKPSDGNA